ncbi:MAG: type II secretion system F family protein [Betaproteobacteria bacterium]|nr:type II secretion system F family protein [Betaproteobacteria bacterium]
MAELSLQQISAFTKQLATLLGAGIPLLQALETLANGVTSKPLQLVASKLKLSVSQGSSFQQALIQSDAFDVLYCQLVAAGEVSGTLDQVLVRLSEHLDKKRAIQQKVGTAMIYPLAVLAIATLVITVIMVWVVPVFEGIFASFAADLPAATVWVLQSSRWLVVHGPSWLGLLAFTGWLARAVFQRHDHLQLLLAVWLLRVPLVGMLISTATLATWTRCMATLLQASVPLLDALEVTAGTCRNRAFAITTLAIRHSVSQGRGLAQAMQAVYPLGTKPGIPIPLFPAMLVQMVMIGEESGALAHLLSQAASELEQQIEHHMQRMVQLLEPLMLVVLGGTVGGLVIALYLPVFQMGQLM